MTAFIKFSFKLIVLGLFSQVSMAASSQEIIDGFSEFIIERSDANLVAVFERRLKNDSNFQCYFPNTYERIDNISLNNLFSSRSYWETGLSTDLEVLVYRSLLVEIQRSLKLFDDEKVAAFLDLSNAIEILQHFEYVKDDQRYSLVSIEPGLSDSLKSEINGFSDSFAELSLKVVEIDQQKLVENVCQVKNTGLAGLRAMIEPYASAGSLLIEWTQHVSDFGANIRLSEQGREELYCRLNNINRQDCSLSLIDEQSVIAGYLEEKIPSKLVEAVSVANRIRHAFDVLDQLARKEIIRIENIETTLPALLGGTFSEQDIQDIKRRLDEAKELSEGKINEWKSRRREIMAGVLATIKQKVDANDIDAVRITQQLRDFVEDRNFESFTDRTLVSLELLEDSIAFSPSSYARLRNSVMFFASIADADDKDGVKSILRAYTLPPVSFAEKRKQGEGVFITSYLGMAGSEFDDRGSNEKISGNGLFAPVGIEFNYGFDNGGSWSIMLSPIDMAYPINLKLNGIEEEVEFDELVAPSISFAYGLENYPITVGVGYQRGRTLNDVDKAEEGYLLFIGFDMPLLRLY